MNQRVAEKFIAFGKAFFKFFQKNEIYKFIPTYTESRVVFAEDGKWLPQAKREVDYLFLLLHRTEKHLWTIPEADAAARILIEEKILDAPAVFSKGKPVKRPSWTKIREKLSGQLLSVVCDYLERTNRYDFVPHQFRKSYAKHERSWLGGKIIVHVSVPLFGIRSKIKSIKVTHEFRIEKFTAKQKTELPCKMDFQPSVSGMNFYDYADCKFRFYGKYQIERGSFRDVQDLRRVAGNCITALRLLHDGHVGTHNLMFQVKPLPIDRLGALGDIRFSMNDFRLPSEDISHRLPGYQYNLTRSDLGPFRRVYQLLSDPTLQSHRSGLGVSIRRFNQVYYRRNVEDSIIDLVIALESCLLHGERAQTYRLAQRGAALLRRKKKPSETFKILRALYRTRNSIVHDGKPLQEIISQGKIHDVPAKQFLPKVLECTRGILICYLAQVEAGKSIQEVNSDVDQLILNRIDITRPRRS